MSTKYLNDYGTGVKPKQFSQKHTQEEWINMQVINTIPKGNFGI